MATKLFLRNTTTNGITGAAIYYDMLVTDGGDNAGTSQTDTVSSGTEIQFTDTALNDTPVQWISGRVPAGGFTLSNTDISILARESAMAVNAGGRYRIFKRTSGGTETEIGGGPFDDGVEFGTSDTVMTWTGNVTDTSFAEDDRILLKIYAINIGTMGAGSINMTFNGTNTFLNIAETVTFKAESSENITPDKWLPLSNNPLPEQWGIVSY